MVKNFIIGSVLSLVFASQALSATLTWDRNTEADMKDYHVYGCFTHGCAVQKIPAQLIGTVNQTATGTLPIFVVDLVNKEGAVAVSARDLTLNESGISVSVPFDVKSPTVPGGPRFQ